MPKIEHEDFDAVGFKYEHLRGNFGTADAVMELTFCLANIGKVLCDIRDDLHKIKNKNRIAGKLMDKEAKL